MKIPWFWPEDSEVKIQKVLKFNFKKKLILENQSMHPQ